MKLTVKNLNGQLILLQADHKNTILELKTKIKSQKGYQVDQQKIVFNGKTTSNTDQLQKLQFKEGDFLILMTTVKKQQFLKKKQKKQETFKIREEKYTQKQSKIKETKPQSKSKQKRERNQQNQLSEVIVSELMTMGFPRNSVEKALKAAWNNPDNAVEYLLSGDIPQNPLESNQAERLERKMDTVILTQLVNNSQFANFKQIIRGNPSALEPILMQIKQASPHIYSLITSNPETFERLIIQDTIEESYGDFPNKIQQQQTQSETTVISQKEQQAIQSLISFGFSKLEAAQAYAACDKNEQMAANFLFDRLANGDIEMQIDSQDGRGSGNGNNKNG